MFNKQKETKVYLVLAFTIIQLLFAILMYVYEYEYHAFGEWAVLWYNDEQKMVLYYEFQLASLLMSYWVLISMPVSCAGISFFFDCAA